jgi:hypothetical protein
MRVVINSNFTTVTEYPAPPEPSSHHSQVFTQENQCSKWYLYFRAINVTEKKALRGG